MRALPDQLARGRQSRPPRQDLFEKRNSAIPSGGRRRILRLALFALLWFALLCGLAGAEPLRYVRLGPATFDTSITRFASKGRRVDLVAMVHVGEKAYYQQLNERLKGYDVVLYELIAQPPGDPNREELYDLIGMQAPVSNPVPVKGGTDNETTASQRQMCEKLGLEFQLDHIDYTAANFRHADITPLQLEKLMAGHKEDNQAVLSRLFQLLGRRKRSRVTEVQLLRYYLGKPTPESRSALRLFLGECLLDLRGAYQAMNGAEARAYIDKRNAKALKVLKQQLKDGRCKIAILYGAAHMPDLERHLRQDFGLHPDGQEWRQAWALKAP